MYDSQFLSFGVFWLTILWLALFSIFSFNQPKSHLRGYGIISLSYCAIMIMAVIRYYWR